MKCLRFKTFDELDGESNFSFHEQQKCKKHSCGRVFTSFDSKGFRKICNLTVFEISLYRKPNISSHFRLTSLYILMVA